MSSPEHRTTATGGYLSAYFFDLDGTLTDPKPGITGCIQYALERLGQPVPTRDELEWCIGPPLQASFERLAGEAKAARGVELYRERFGSIGLFENEVYAGIPDALRAAKGAGHRLFVASSKPKVYVDRILEHFELMPFFEATYGSELDGRHADKSTLLEHALRDSDTGASQALMIGDRGVDAIGAKHNGMAFLGVLYGYGSREEFEAEGALEWVHTPEQLSSELRRQGYFTRASSASIVMSSEITLSPSPSKKEPER